MKKMSFKNYKDFVEKIDDIYENVIEAYGDLNVIGNYFDIKETFRMLMILGYDIACVDILSPYLNDCLEDESENIYCLSINEDGLWCEKITCTTQISSDVVFVSGDCNSKILEFIDSDVTIEYDIDTEYDCSGCDYKEDCPNYQCDNYEEYIVNGVHVTKDEFDAYTRKFENEFYKAWYKRFVEIK